MFERFTDRAKKVMALANQEARRLNHDYIGSEHILLGLIKEGSGIGATILKLENLDFGVLRRDIEKLIPSGNENFSIGKFTPDKEAENSIQSAREYARKLRHNYVGTEHLLYGIVTEESNAAKILALHDITSEDIHNKLESLIGASGLDEEDKQKPEPESWIVPRKSMDIKEVLSKYGFNVEGDGLKINIYSSLKQNPRRLVGKLKDKTPFIIYDLQDMKQIQSALNLRYACEINQQRYAEQESLFEVAKKLRAPHEEVISVINRLEKIISEQK